MRTSTTRLMEQLDEELDPRGRDAALERHFRKPSQRDHSQAYAPVS